MGPYLLVTGDFRRTGGMDRANYALAEYLARQGAEVHLVANHVDAELIEAGDVRWHRVPRPGGLFLLGMPLLDRVGRLWARRIARRGGRVVVNGGNCRWGDVNWVHYVHAAFRPQTATDPLRRAKNRVERALSLRDERLTLRRARLVIVNSDRTGRDVIERLGVPAGRVRTIYYGIDPTRFGPITAQERAEALARFGWSADRPRVAFIGALGDRRKGFDTLFTAWSRLCAEPGWDADLVVVGAGGELPLWKARAAEAGLAGRFHFLGFTSEVPRVLAACDALVHPVRYEAYGLGVHEALCRGLPALVSASAGVAERYPPELQGLLLPDPEDAEALRARLLAWRADRDVYRARVVDFGATLRAYSWDDMAAAMIRAMCDES